MEGTGEREATREGRRAGVRGRREAGRRTERRKKNEESGKKKGVTYREWSLSKRKKMNDKVQWFMIYLENDKK